MLGTPCRLQRSAAGPSPNTWSPHLGLDRSLILTQSHTNIGQHNGAMDLPPDLNVEKLAAEMAGNTMMDEKKVNDQTYQQIVAFLKTEKVNAFRYRCKYKNNKIDFNK